MLRSKCALCFLAVHWGLATSIADAAHQDRHAPGHGSAGGAEAANGGLLQSKRLYERREKRGRGERGRLGGRMYVCTSSATRRAAWCCGAVQTARRRCWSYVDLGGRITISILPPPRRLLQDPLRKEPGSHLRPKRPTPPRCTCPQGAPLSDRCRSH